MSKIVSIVFRPLGEKYEDRNGLFIRDRVKTGTLLAGHGLEGDAKAGKHAERQLNILSQEWLEEVKEKGYRVFPGSFGEQLTLSGVPLENLAPGSQLQLGSTAVVEISKPRTGCDRLIAAQGQDLTGLGDHVGILAQVVTGGPISVGDPVTLIN